MPPHMRANCTELRFTPRSQDTLKEKRLGTLNNK